ncbi:primosomal protein N' [uncultured Ilyobacter sp.]|uniref:replication restart helicase PriA n=1 Tax=uncultured Ilyobacter sp. TaxID=544433 RepID=UPI0029C78BE4|nr:primosomal protein N' [uncultured Ilyobacter sp.]
MRYYGVYVDGTNDFFTYCDLKDEFNIGERVAVPFRGRIKSGLIVYRETFETFEFKVLPITRKLESQIHLSESMIKLLLWIKNYYLCSFGQTFGAAIPGNLKVEYSYNYRFMERVPLKTFEEKELGNYFRQKAEVTKATLCKKFSKELVRDALEKGVLKGKNKLFLEENFGSEYQELSEYYSQRMRVGKTTLEKRFSKDIVEKMVRRGIVFLEKTLKDNGKLYDIDEADGVYSKESTVLNIEQETAVAEIESSERRYFLLKGVTGSGKTEVYLKLIRKALEKGQGSIFLVPEISLTPQMVKRFKGEFRENIAILHSKLTPVQRAKEWLSIYTGEKKVVLGVRSAVFAPVKNLKYVIIDEEHEATYKQDSNPRYNAKYVGIKRGELEDAKIVLGSATPSIESYYFAKEGVFKLLELKERYNGANLPKLKLVDMKDEKSHYFSRELLKDMSETLRKDEQIMLLLNRKGYSTYIQCLECGHVEECPNCSITMNYYMSQGIYKCNYCGETKRYTGTCSSCKSKNLSHMGKGTERLEEEIRKYFDVGIIRVDSESSKERNFYDNMYREFLEKKYHIMLGTQIISKGFHFPNVTLVGVINADSIMNFPDFRSGEKTFQLVSQVAGRAGRESKKGEVLIQTFQPENHVMKRIIEGDYEGFYLDEIETRKILSYPPFSRIINIIITSIVEEGLENYARKFYDMIKDEGVEVYGPMKAPVYRVKGRYRYQIFLKGTRQRINAVKPVLDKCSRDLRDEKYRVVIDVDPINLM